MTDLDRVFAGSIPEIYDRLLVPLIFTGYAEDLAARVAETRPSAVLETAAGSGVVTRALAPRLGPDARYAATDLNPAMLDRAKARQGEDPRIAWRVADAQALPFEDASFDVVICQFGAMFFPDKVGAYREARRVLKPGGRFLFNVWDAIEANDFARAVTSAAGRHFAEDPPLFLARTPHGYHRKDEIARHLAAAGFDRVEIDTVEKRSVAASAREPALAFCTGTPLRAEIDARDPAALDRVTDLATEAIAEAYGSGPVSGRIRAHVVAARRA
jgi:ubiquinone/menaquinone biosynthesis C-methylase UbiE